MEVHVITAAVEEEKVTSKSVVADVVAEIRKSRPRKTSPKKKDMIRRRHFQCTVRAIAHTVAPGYRFQSSALEALREATESVLENLFADGGDVDDLCVTFVKLGV